MGKRLRTHKSGMKLDSPEPGRTTRSYEEAVSRIDFSGLYRVRNFSDISYRHWKGFPEYTVGSKVQLVRQALMKLEPESPSQKTRALLLALYLEPHNAKGWMLLRRSASQLLPAYCEQMEMHPQEIEEIFDLGDQVTNGLSLDADPSRVLRLIKEWIIFEPGYHFWNRLFQLAPQWLESYTPDLEPKYFRARDYACAYDPQDIYALNIALPLVPDPEVAIFVYTDRMGPDGPNHQYLLHQLLRFLQIPIFRPHAKELVSKIAPIIWKVGYYNYTPPLPNTYDWLKLAWQFSSEKDSQLALALGSTAYWAEDYAIAVPLLRLCAASATTGEAWGASLKLVKYYGDEEHNLKEATYWANNAHQIIPDGQAFDLLGLEAQINGNMDASEQIIANALKFGDNESRQDAALAIFAHATRIRAEQLPHDETLAITAEKVEQLSQLISKYTDPLRDIRQTLLTSMSEQVAINQSLRADVRRLQVTLHDYRAKFDLDGGQDSEQAIIDQAQKLVPVNRPAREKVFAHINEDFPQALDPVRELLVDAHLIYLMLTEVNPHLQDWSAPLVYIAKAVETQLRLQLSELPEFIKAQNSLGGAIKFLGDHFASTSQHFGIADSSRLKSHLNDLKEFKDKYRNGFIHQELMERSFMEDMMEFIVKRGIFRRYRYM